MRTEREKLEIPNGGLYGSPKTWIVKMNSCSLLCASPQSEQLDDYDPEEL